MRLALLLALACTSVAPQAAYRRRQTAELVARLSAYPPGYHLQRCEIISLLAKQCARDGYAADDCGVDLFEDRQGELGCKP